MINSFIKPEFNSRHFHLYEKKILDLIKTALSGKDRVFTLNSLSVPEYRTAVFVYLVECKNVSANFTEFTLLCDQTLTSLPGSVRRHQRPASHVCVRCLEVVVRVGGERRPAAHDGADPATQQGTDLQC